MIFIIADGNAWAPHYEQAFIQAGATVAGMTACDFEAWLSTTSDDELSAIDAVLFGEYLEAIELVVRLRRRTDAALIAIDAETTLERTLAAFAAGFDDVIDRTCHVREIMARIAAVARRSTCGAATSAEHLAIDVLGDGRAPRVGATPLELPRREHQILAFLARRAGRRVTKDQIFLAVYGVLDEQTNVQVIEFHICRLRKRLRERLGYDPIDSRRHQGYLLDCRAMIAATPRQNGA